MTDQSDAIVAAIRLLEQTIGAHVDAMPEEIFLFLSRVTPLVNVDLLIQDENRRTVLTWRSDRFYGPGWHVPGGVIRPRELASQRIAAVASRELGTQVCHDPEPFFVQQSINEHRADRGHFISMLYRCRLVGMLDPMRQCVDGRPIHGQWMWHDGCPDALIPEQREYAAFMF